MIDGHIDAPTGRPLACWLVVVFVLFSAQFSLLRGTTYDNEGTDAHRLVSLRESLTANSFYRAPTPQSYSVTVSVVLCIYAILYQAVFRPIGCRSLFSVVRRVSVPFSIPVWLFVRVLRL